MGNINYYKESNSPGQTKLKVKAKETNNSKAETGEKKKMTTIKESAENYEPRTTKNITDLEIVSVEMDVFQGEGTNKEGKDFTYEFIKVNEEEYRLPASVKEQLQEHLKEKPELKTFKVTKKGDGLNTTYTVIPLE